MPKLSNLFLLYASKARGCSELTSDCLFFLFLSFLPVPMTLNSRNLLFILNYSGFSSWVFRFLLTILDRVGRVLKLTLYIDVLLAELAYSGLFFLADSRFQGSGSYV